MFCRSAAKFGGKYKAASLAQAKSQELTASSQRLRIDPVVPSPEQWPPNQLIERLGDAAHPLTSPFRIVSWFGSPDCDAQSAGASQALGMRLSRPVIARRQDSDRHEYPSDTQRAWVARVA